jgi:hypothetical protein
VVGLLETGTGACILVGDVQPWSKGGVATLASLQGQGGRADTTADHLCNYRWSEDAESQDLTLRVSGDSVVGGGLVRRYVTIDFDLVSQVGCEAGQGHLPTDSCTGSGAHIQATIGAVSQHDRLKLGMEWGAPTPSAARLSSRPG